MNSNTLDFIIVLLNVALIVFGLLKHRSGAKWGLWLAVAGVVVALASTYDLIARRHRQSQWEHVMQRYQAVIRAGGLQLGQHLAAKYPGSKALVLVPPSLPPLISAQDSPVLSGLKEGMGTAVTIVSQVSPEVPKEILAQIASVRSAKESQSRTFPLFENWFTPEVFAKMVGPYAGQYDILISFVGLPLDQEEPLTGKTKSSPRVVIAEGMVRGWRRKIEAGSITAMLHGSLKTPFVFSNLTPEKIIEKATAVRHLLITPDNVAEMAKKYPELFEAERVDTGQTHGPK